jgi:hypothetical protein
MRQRDHVERAAGELGAARLADHLGELVDVGPELRDRELADRDDEARPQQAQLGVQMAAAPLDLGGRRHAIASAARGLARKTSAHRGHVDARTKFVFGEAERREPSEHRLAGGPREWFAGRALVRAGRLTDQHDRRHDGRAADDRADHVGARVARAQPGDVTAKLDERRHAPTLCRAAGVCQVPRRSR